MPITRSLIGISSLALPVALFAIAPIAVPRGSAAPNPAPLEPAAAQSVGVEVEVRCIDDSVLKLRLMDEKVELVTRYGLLQVPLAEIRRIDFAQRCPTEVAEKIAVALSKLGHPDFQTRERATAELKGYRERAYPFLLKALKHDDPEVSRRADEAVRFIQSRVPAGLLEARESDVVITDDCKITGRLTAQTLRVQTAMFGEQALKLADVRVLRSSAGQAADELQGALPAPTNLSTYQQQFGKELIFSLTGAVPNGQSSSVWGTDTYSLDSSLAAAAVHAGLARPGEVVAVRVRIVQSPQQFIGSSRNGVISAGYGHYPAGAFEFIRK